MSEHVSIEDLISNFAIEQFEGKRINDLYPNHRIIENSSGRFLEIVWDESQTSISLDTQSTHDKLLSNLAIVENIGEKIERRLRSRGISSLKQLKWVKEYNSLATTILDLIEKKDYRALCKYKHVYDIDLSFCFEKSDFLFLDIETLGLYHEPIILIGLGWYNTNSFEIHMLFARDLNEEMALLEHMRKEIFPHFSCFITYNGKSFDIPFIVNRFLYFFEENPLISNEGDFVSQISSNFHHIDLLHNCRRKFKSNLRQFSLINVEKIILNIERKYDLPGYLIGEVYRLYQADKKKYVGLIKLLIEHNFFDIYSMPLIYEKLLVP
jgi:hypothetical protein